MDDRAGHASRAAERALRSLGGGVSRAPERLDLALPAGADPGRPIDVAALWGARRGPAPTGDVTVELGAGARLHLIDGCGAPVWLRCDVWRRGLTIRCAEGASMRYTSLRNFEGVGAIDVTIDVSAGEDAATTLEELDLSGAAGSTMLRADLADDASASWLRIERSTRHGEAFVAPHGAGLDQRRWSVGDGAAAAAAVAGLAQTLPLVYAVEILAAAGLPPPPPRHPEEDP